jgi:small subunit ribosomal protein S5
MMNQQVDLTETVVHINRVAKVVKGGKNFSFSAVVVAGDGSGSVGYGTGKAREVPPAIQKASESAKREMIRVPMVGGTVPHLVWGRWGATRVLLRPASPGTGVIAGGGVRAVMESAGVQDVLTKIVGSRNPFNVVRATFDAINNLMTTDQVVRLRGIEAAQPADAEKPADAPAAADETPAEETPAEEAPAAEAAEQAVEKPAEETAPAEPEAGATEAAPEEPAAEKPEAEGSESK